jgi:ankyrin repeat protein
MTDCGATALIMACEQGHLEIARFLLEHRGAFVHGVDSSGDNSLALACTNGHLEIVRLVLQHGAHINAARALCGSTPLILASRCGHVTIVRLLLEHGALRHLVNHAGHTARDLAAGQPLVLAALA